MTDLTAVSLFAGVGGFDLAMQRHGIRVAATVEIDPKARDTLTHHFPDTTHLTDITEVTGDDLRAAGFIPERGILTGGFPCQDLSVAGRRAGLDGERSGLFWEIARLIDELGPRWVVIENVAGLLSSQRGRDMGIVLRTLGDLGYGFAYRVLDSQFFGVPQRRRRVFIVAARCAGGPDERGPVEVLAECEGVRGDPAPLNTSGQETAGTLGGGSGARGWACDTDRMTFVPYVKAARAKNSEDAESWREGDVSPTLNVFDNASETRATVLSFYSTGGSHTANRQEDICPPLKVGSGLGISSPPAVLVDGVRRLTPRECERLQGFPDDWTGMHADSTRYRMMGNAVTVPVVEWIIGRLMRADERSRV